MEGALATARQVGREGPALLDGVDLDGSAVRGESLLEQPGEAGEGARAEDDVRARDVLANALAVTLGDAAADGDDATPRGGRRGGDHRGGLPIESLVGVLTHAAGHEDHDVGIVGVLDADAPRGVEEARDALTTLSERVFPGLKVGETTRPILESDLARTSVYSLAIERWSGKENWADRAIQEEGWPALGPEWA